MKRFIYLFILSLLAGLTACGGGSKKTDEGSLILMQDSVDKPGIAAYAGIESRSGY